MTDVTQYLDLKLLAMTIAKDEPTLQMDVKALLKREEFLKKEDEEKKG